MRACGHRPPERGRVAGRVRDARAVVRKEPRRLAVKRVEDRQPRRRIVGDLVGDADARGVEHRDDRRVAGGEHLPERPVPKVAVETDARAARRPRAQGRLVRTAPREVKFHAVQPLHRLDDRGKVVGRAHVPRIGEAERTVRADGRRRRVHTLDPVVEDPRRTRRAIRPRQFHIPLRNGRHRVCTAVDAFRHAPERREQGARHDALERLRPGIHHVHDPERPRGAGRPRRLSECEGRQRRDKHVRRRFAPCQFTPPPREGAVRPDTPQADVRPIGGCLHEDDAEVRRLPARPPCSPAPPFPLPAVQSA